MAEENKEQVSENAGNTENTQVSGSDGNTGPQTGDTQLDLAKIYVLDPRTDDKMTGLEVKTLVNQGKLHRKQQSEFDKSVSEMSKTKERYETEMAQLRTKVELLETNRRIDEMKETTSDDDTFDPFAEEPATKKTVNPVKSDRQINPEEIEKKVMSLVDQRLDLERQQRDMIEKSQNFDRARDRALRIQFKKEFPSADEDEIQDMIGSMDVVRKNDLDARNRYGDDMDKAMELIIEGDSYSLRAAKAMATAMMKQDRADAKAKQQREIETITKGVFEPPTGKETKPVSNPKNEMKARQQRRKDAEENLHKMNAVKMNG